MTDYWSKYPRGTKAKLARLAKVHPSIIYAVLSRKRHVSLQRALCLQRACEALNLRITWHDWIANSITDHPAFCKGKV